MNCGVTCARSLYSFLTVISLLENYQQHMITKPKNLFTAFKTMKSDYFRYVMTRPKRADSNIQRYKTIAH